MSYGQHPPSPFFYDIKIPGQSPDSPLLPFDIVSLWMALRERKEY